MYNSSLLGVATFSAVFSPLSFLFVFVPTKLVSIILITSTILFNSIESFEYPALTFLSFTADFITVVAANNGAPAKITPNTA